MKIYQKVSTTLLTGILMTIILSPSVEAQEAPEFSNELMMDNKTWVFFMADRLEYNMNRGLNPLVWDAQGYVGKDLNKFWIKAEGEALTTRKEGEMEFQGLYSRAISPFFDAQMGIRYDVAYHRAESRSRGFAVIGLQGMAPYFFEVDGNLFVSETGNVSANVEAEYDLPITQRLWGQPRLGTSIAVQDVPEWGVGSGFNDVQLGLRLRYEIKREFAPYIGISWNRKLGETADFARLEGERTTVFGLVGGVRMWL